MNKEKQHDSIMNSVDSTLEISLDMTWLQLYDTKEYSIISEAVWRLCHGTFKLKEDE